MHEFCLFNEFCVMDESVFTVWVFCLVPVDEFLCLFTGDSTEH